MASLSPAVHATRPAPFIDPHRQAEYPVLLGESLQDTAGTRNQFFSVEYNWKPKNLPSKQRTVITKANTQYSADAPYHLTIQEAAAETKPYQYAGNVRQNEAQNGSTASPPEDQTTSLALVFNQDQEKPAFVLEKISAALEFNLTSAPDQSHADVQAHSQLPLATKPDKEVGVTRETTSSLNDDDDDEPDAANPYDYRHFLEEAKANAEKGLGSRTPIPGGLSGFSSPVPGPARFGAASGPGTPVHKPVTSTPSAQVKKRKPAEEHYQDSRLAASARQRKPAAPKSKHTISTSTSSSKSKPLSKERISDSGEEIGDTITLSRPSTTYSASRPEDRRKTPTSTAKSGYTSSPRIEVDEAADLVIDMGSPPPVARRRLGAGLSSPFALARSQPPKETRSATTRTDLEPMEEEEEEDAEGEPDDDVVMHDFDGAEADADADMDADGDVEDLVLGSPKTNTTRAPSVSVSRVDIDGNEDEDDELAAELEAALENDDEDGDGVVGGIGLGITTVGAGAGAAAGAGAEDESEISEEE